MRLSDLVKSGQQRRQQQQAEHFDPGGSVAAVRVADTAVVGLAVGRLLNLVAHARLLGGVVAGGESCGAVSHDHDLISS